MKNHFKKIISLVLILGLIIILPRQAEAAIAVVQAGSADNAGAGAASVTLTITSGNLIYVTAGTSAGGGGCGTIAISDGTNTYTPISSYVSQSFNCSRNYYVANAVGGSLTISANFNPNTTGGINVYEVSGADTASPLDVNASGTCGASPCTSASFSTASANEIVFMSATNYYFTGAWSSGNIGGVASTIATNGSHLGVADGVRANAAEYVIFTSTQSSITAAISKSGTIFMDFFVASFKQASGGGITAPIHKITMNSKNKYIFNGASRNKYIFQ